MKKTIQRTIDQVDIKLYQLSSKLALKLQRSKPFVTCYTIISEFREKRYTFWYRVRSFVCFMFLTFLYVEYVFCFIREKEPAFSQVSLNRFLQTKRN